MDLKELERFGSLSIAITPAARADKEARTNAGTLPPPNNSSQGPAPRDTIIYDKGYQGKYVTR